MKDLRRNCIRLTFFLFLFGGARTTLAQESGIDAYGTFGTTWHDSAPGTAVNVGAGIGWQPFMGHDSLIRGLAVEFEVHHSPSITDSPDGISSRTSATGSLTYYFPLEGVEPYVGIGMGGSDHTRNPSGSATGNPRAIYVGTLAVGARFQLGDGWFVRPEVRAFKGILSGHISSPGGRAHYIYRGAVAIGYRW